MLFSFSLPGSVRVHIRSKVATSRLTTMHFPRLRTNLTIWPPPQTSSLDDFILLFCYYRMTNNEQDLEHKSLTISTKSSEGSTPSKIHQRTAMAVKVAQAVITELQAHQAEEASL